MKLAIYALAAILVAGLAVGVSFSYTPSVENGSEISTEREVYVNVTKLTKLHPSYAAFVEMRATLANIDAGSQKLVSQDQPELSIDKVARKTSGTMNRNDMVAAVAKSAMADLFMLESDQREALRARLSEKREIMMEDAEAEIKLQVFETEDAAAKKLRSVSEQYVTERLNAQIRTIALRSAAKSLGVDQLTANLNLDKARAELVRIDSECLTQENEVNAKTRARISELRANAEKSIDSALLQYISEENLRIDGSATVARKQTFREIKSFDSIANHTSNALLSRSKFGKSVKLPKYAAVASSSDTKAFVALEKKASEIEKRIKEDVVHTVQKLAEKRGMKVIFTQGEHKLPDETQMFRGLMRECAWEICEPVLIGMRGS